MRSGQICWILKNFAAILILQNLCGPKHKQPLANIFQCTKLKNKYNVWLIFWQPWNWIFLISEERRIIQNYIFLHPPLLAMDGSCLENVYQNLSYIWILEGHVRHHYNVYVTYILIFVCSWQSISTASDTEKKSIS